MGLWKILLIAREVAPGRRNGERPVCPRIPEFVPNSSEELVAQITPENRHGETNWGPAVGKEIW